MRKSSRLRVVSAPKRIAPAEAQLQFAHQIASMDDNDAQKIWVPITVVGSILLFVMVFGCLCNKPDAFERVPPPDLLTRRRGQPGFRIPPPSRHLPTGMPWEEVVRASERPRRPEPIYIVREPRRARSPPGRMGRYGPRFDPEDPWFEDRRPRFPGGYAGRFHPNPRIIEREPLFR